MAQPKGYAIALMKDMLSGVLTGSGYGAEVAGPYQAERRSRAGHLMIVINIEAMQPLTDFNAKNGSSDRPDQIRAAGSGLRRGVLSG